jgi:CheY-like chemotaxis protein
MKSRYVIFADDDADDLELITGFFKQFNRSINVLEFRDGKEVLAFLEEYASNTSLPLLLVLDINMPGLNGMETLAAIRRQAEFRYLPIVMYTTSTNATEKAYCESLGASWVSKSDSMDGIRQTARILAEFCTLQDQ